jgi:hypothetical protein
MALKEVMFKKPRDNRGFTMNSIYQALIKGTNGPVYSIQQFRERWEQLHPDVTIK